MIELTTVPSMPRAAERSTADDSNAVAYWALASFMSAIATFMTLHAMRQLLAVTDNPVLESLSGLLWLGGLAAPLLVALKGLLVGSVVWAALELQGVRSGYVRCLAAAYAAEIALTFAALLQAAVALLRGPATVQDLVVPLGLDIVWQPASPVAAVLSRTLTPFLLAWAVVMVLQLRDNGRPQRAQVAVAVCVGAAVVACLPLLSVL